MPYNSFIVVEHDFTQTTTLGILEKLKRDSQFLQSLQNVILSSKEIEDYLSKLNQDELDKESAFKDIQKLDAISRLGKQARELTVPRGYVCPAFFNLRKKIEALVKLDYPSAKEVLSEIKLIPALVSKVTIQYQNN